MSLCIVLSGNFAKAVHILDQLDPQIEIVEVRIDLFEDYNDCLEKIFQTAKTKKISSIATVRDIKTDPGFSKTRLELVKRCLRAGCTWVDLEVEAPNEYQTEVIQEAKKHNTLVIISHHNYEAIEESSENLKEIVEDCFAKGADVAKVAVTVISSQGAARVLSLYNDNRCVVALGMGGPGKITRIAALGLGAPFSFAAWDESSASAPGQLTRQEMKSALSMISEQKSPAKRQQML